MNNQNDYIEAAQQIIVSLGLPRAQQNERSALCLLALLNLTPGKAWADAENPLVGITPIMDWAREHYGKEYAPNTRETFRRQSMHQFCDAGVALYNPDKPDRPVAVKVQLLGAGGVAQYATYNGKDPFWIAWAPLPKRRATAPRPPQPHDELQAP